MTKFDALTEAMAQLKGECDTKDHGDIILATTLKCAIQYASTYMNDETFDQLIKTITPSD